MDKKDLKKLLTGLSLVALIGGAGLSAGCAATGTTATRVDDKEVDTQVRDNTDGNLSG